MYPLLFRVSVRYGVAMGRPVRQTGAMHVSTTTRRSGDREYNAVLLRRSFREDGKVKKETLANLSHLPPEAIDAIRRVLAGGDARGRAGRV